ncbi:hypothetical protein EWM64_g9649 [Hericium alpestre]|uniref:Uncharacterized protein n=1 Tax=Hericium alpestre TaxID=135208 RepID=A0A4Y9ZKE7_9AGAM|nr:hypothetical protein EWM64_g9649 [Hericium alpestre]
MGGTSQLSDEDDLSQSREGNISAYSSQPDLSAMDDTPLCSETASKDAEPPESRPKSPAKPRFFSIFTKSYAKVPGAERDSASSSMSKRLKPTKLRHREQARSPISSLSSSVQTGIKAVGRQLSDAASVLHKRRRSSVSGASEAGSEGPSAGKALRKESASKGSTRKKLPAEETPEDGDAINLGAVGISRSAAAARKNQEIARTEEFRPTIKKLETWKRKLTEQDPDVEFFPNNAIDARHSDCGKVIFGQDIYSASQFLRHVEECNGNEHDGDRTKENTLTSMWSKSTKKRHTGSSKGKEKMLPCPGLTANDDPRIARYTERSGAEGGGARSIPVIVAERFEGKEWAELDDHQRKQVKDIQRHEHTWRTDHEGQRVFSTKCLHEVSQDHTAVSGNLAWRV